MRRISMVFVVVISAGFATVAHGQTETNTNQPDLQKNIQIENAWSTADGDKIIFLKPKDMFDDNPYPTTIVSNCYSFYCKDGNCFQIADNHFDSGGPSSTGTPGNITINFPDSHLGETPAKFEASPEKGTYTLTCGDKAATYAPMDGVDKDALQKQIQDHGFNLTAVPSTRQPQYLFKIKGTEQYVYLAGTKYFPSNNFKMYVGTLNNMTEVPLGLVDVTRGDGWRVDAKDGRRLSMMRDQVPTWDKKPVVAVDTKTFDFSSMKLPASASGSETLHTPCDPMLNAPTGTNTTGTNSNGEITGPGQK